MDKDDINLMRMYFEKAKTFSLIYIDDKYDLSKVMPTNEHIDDIVSKFMSAVLILDENKLERNPYYYVEEKIYEMTHNEDEVKKHKLKEERKDYQICVGMIQKYESENKEKRK